MKLPKAILLDLDDTIIAYDHGVDLDACWRTACRNRFPHESEEQIETWVRAIRKEDRWFWSDEERLRTGRRDLHRTTVSFVAEALRKCGFDDRASRTPMGSQLISRRRGTGLRRYILVRWRRWCTFVS